MSVITEPITKAADCAAMCWSDLREASDKATPLETLHIKHLMEQAAMLSGQLARFRDAIDA